LCASGRSGSSSRALRQLSSAPSESPMSTCAAARFAQFCALFGCSPVATRWAITARCGCSKW
jgi:hypothetical protein